MKTEMGEYIVGAYLKLVEGCDVVDYNVRPPAMEIWESLNGPPPLPPETRDARTVHR